MTIWTVKPRRTKIMESFAKKNQLNYFQAWTEFWSNRPCFFLIRYSILALNGKKKRQNFSINVPFDILVKKYTSSIFTAHVALHWQKCFFAPLPGRTEFRLLPTARKISTSLIENGTQQTTAPEKETVEIKTMGSFSVNRMNEAT